MMRGYLRGRLRRAHTASWVPRGISVLLTLVLSIGLFIGPSMAVAAQPHSSSTEKTQSDQQPPPAEFVILFVLEGIGQGALKAGPMPVLSRLVEKGSVTWSATNPTPNLRLPSVASIITGLPVEKHGINWDEFDFARGYPRAPTLFDYMDLSGGKDTAVFFMDESLYQLARPEPYIDYQMCGPLRPECTSDTVVKYIRDYLVKGASGEGYGRRILDLPHLLLVHFPEAGRVGQVKGWKSGAYHQALKEVDQALGDVLDVYRHLEMLDRTTVFVTALNGEGDRTTAKNGDLPTEVPLIAWGLGIKSGYMITHPVSLLDIGATVMETLGLETYTEWDSQPVEEIFRDPHRKKRASKGEQAHGR